MAARKCSLKPVALAWATRCTCGKKTGSRRAQGGQWQDHGLHALHARHETFQPVDQDGQPHHQRQCEAERKAHAGFGEQRAVEAECVDEQGRGNRPRVPTVAWGRQCIDRLARASVCSRNGNRVRHKAGRQGCGAEAELQCRPFADSTRSPFTMLDNLTNRLARVMKTLKGEARLTESNITDALREVRMALARGRRRPAGDQGVHCRGQGKGGRRGGHRLAESRSGAGRCRASRTDQDHGRCP